MSTLTSLGLGHSSALTKLLQVIRLNNARLCSSSSSYYDLNKRRYEWPTRVKHKPQAPTPKISSVLKPSGVSSTDIKELDKKLASLDKLISDINIRIAEQKEQLDINDEEMQNQFGEVLPKRYLSWVNSVDASCPPSKHPCVGCGAPIHCCAPNQPGFISSSRFQAMSDIELQNCKCLRCKGLEYHGLLLDSKISAEEYRKILSSVKYEKTAIIHVIDVTDYQNSFISDLLDIMGNFHPVYVVANKIDLIPKDSPGYLNHIQSLVEDYAHELYGSRVKGVVLASALTGYGIEQLVNKLLKQTSERHVGFHLVGCTNSGKSSVFNSLLLSDLCQVGARNKISRATTSIWPGTTLNLLKFPVNRPSRYMLAMRAQRLRELQETEGYSNTTKTRSIASTTLKGLVDVTEPPDSKSIQISNSKLKGEDQYELKSTYDLNSEKGGELWENSSSLKKPVSTFDYEEFAESRWLHDTPGLVNKQQLINHLSMTDLRRLLMKKMALPRTFHVRPGMGLYIGGIGRVDCLKLSNGSDEALLLTVVAAGGLPINCMYTEQSAQFYQQMLEQNKLVIPSAHGDQSTIPELIGHTVDIECVSYNKSIADIQLSSIGWVSVAGPRGVTATLRAYTPGGLGVHTRPSLLPYAVFNKGKRVRGKRAYKQRNPM